MNNAITVGGISIILAVFAIFVFIFLQTLPLGLFPGFGNASLKAPEAAFETGVSDFVAIGSDEWAELPFLVSKDATFYFADLKFDRGVIEKRPPFSGDVEVTALNYHQQDDSVVVGTRDGNYAIIEIDYRQDFSDPVLTKVAVDIAASAPVPIGSEPHPIVSIDYLDTDNSRLVAAIQQPDAGPPVVNVVEYSKRRSLFGGTAQFRETNRQNLTAEIDGEPVDLLVSGLGDALLVATKSGSIAYFRAQDGVLTLRQSFAPFPGSRIDSINWLIGYNAFVATTAEGKVGVFSSSRDPNSGELAYQQIKVMKALPGRADLFAASLRNRSFVLTSGPLISLRYSTTNDIRWERNIDFIPTAICFDKKNEHILMADNGGGIHRFDLNDPHPEATWGSYFGKVHYEGQPKPDYIWQSSGSTDAFEPKLSILPLLVGTLKGTFYAMILATPIALLAALYTSQFLRPSHKKIVKPAMELMASLPSVILGFVGALILAPFIEDKVPSVVCAVITLTVGSIAIGFIWQYLPRTITAKVRTGDEFLVVIPFLIIIGTVGWSLGPVVERILFVVTEPETGKRIADFRLWWQNSVGADFSQRNSLVVGFVMGFAVIPIIFTISEDAMSNVPGTFRSASLALGATRWQTAWRVVLPAASAGIFSALMIGFGRAVGETMIMVMATGNTPVYDWNIFSGLRAFSANIAVELPEAPQSGTLYRTLFFTALLLFMMTFVVNTAAEILRDRIRRKFKAAS